MKHKAHWILGLGSLLWLLLRSGPKPSRLTYPCQRTAAVTGAGFLGYLVSITSAAYLHRRLKCKATLVGLGLLALMLLLTIFITGTSPPAYARITNLPGWTSATAISNVFGVQNIPIPQCSLDGGSLPSTGSCSNQNDALHDDGIDSLINEMENRGDYFYKTAGHSTGIVGTNDVVVIKVNNQWAHNGSNRRLCTNTDVLKGLIWRILQHPDGFTGEIVIAENTQGVVWDWNITPANAEDRNQSYQDVVDTFQGLGYPVYLYRWDELNDDHINGGAVGAGGYPTGEYANGNLNDAYILLEDSGGTGTRELSYPKFRTHAGGATVSMRYGVWNGSSYDADRLTFINLPVLKQHGMAGATIAWKNLIGLLTIENHDTRYGNWDEMHDFFWGYTNGVNRNYGLLGRQLAYIGAPDLNIVDAIWVADDNYDGTGTRQDILLASRDPFALDWYASEYVLYPLYSNQDASAARRGIFRDATRTNQNAADTHWPGPYPYIDLLDSYNGDTPNNVERNQMNVYVVDAGTAGPGSYTFNAVITPAIASMPVTYLWSPEPASGQAATSATYQWDTAGIYPVTVTVKNCGGTYTDTYTQTVGTPQLSTLISSSPTQQMMAFQDGVSPNPSYSGTKDVILANDADDNANLGGDENLELYYGDVEYRRSLLRWDISGLPAGITIHNAAVELYRSNTTEADPTQIALYRVTTDWDEGSGDDYYPDPSYTPDGATWITATATVSWTTPGGDYDPAILDQMTIPAGTGNGWISLDATDAVKDWVGGSAPNFGVLLRPLSGEWTVHDFHSRDSSSVALRPRLVVSYTTGAAMPSLDITLPTGSTQWPISSTQQIQWNTTGSVPQINLYYLINGDGIQIGSNLTNNGIYTWTTPMNPTTSAQIRVESVISSTTVYDVSAMFTLYDTTPFTSTIFLPVIMNNPILCVHPLTGVSISGPSIIGTLIRPTPGGIFEQIPFMTD